jgi:hypothetical protein
VGSYPLSSQAPTHIEVESSCDNKSKTQIDPGKASIVATINELFLSLSLLGHYFFPIRCCPRVM